MAGKQAKVGTLVRKTRESQLDQKEDNLGSCALFCYISAPSLYIKHFPPALAIIPGTYPGTHASYLPSRSDFVYKFQNVIHARQALASSQWLISYQCTSSLGNELHNWLYAQFFYYAVFFRNIKKNVSIQNYAEKQTIWIADEAPGFNGSKLCRFL